MIPVMEPVDVRPSRVVIITLLVGLFFTGQSVSMSLAAGRFQFAWDVLQELLYWLVWVALSPLLVTLAHRWPLETRPNRAAIVSHVFASVLLAISQTVVAFSAHVAALWWTGTIAAADAVRLLTHLRPAMVWGVFMGVFFYWVVIGLVALARYRRLYAVEQLSAAQLAGRSAGLEAALATAQLDALRSQLRPHFLFNTLNAISVLAADQPAKAQRMIVSLGSLLRRSLDEKEHEIPLRQELSLLDDYLHILRMRFGDRLAVTVAVPDDAGAVLVPVLLLQPLVENAIEHGWAEAEERASLTIAAERDGGQIRLTVTDNGPGLGGAGPVPEGIGLRNTRERLHRLYGDRASVRLMPAPGGAHGTRAEVVIPMPRAAG